MNDLVIDLEKIRALCQVGLAYSKDPYDIERYKEITELVFSSLSAATAIEPKRFVEVYLPETGYATPKVDLRAGVFDDGKVLLVKEKTDGLWSLPGGWADVHENPSQGVAREVLEETGFNTEVVKLVAVKDRSMHPYQPVFLQHVIKLFFLCDIISHGDSADLGIAETGFFDLDALPDISIDRVLREDIAMLHQHSLDSSLPTYFD